MMRRILDWPFEKKLYPNAYALVFWGVCVKVFIDWIVWVVEKL